MAILVLNAGSSSLKCAVFEGGRQILSGQVEGLGTNPVLSFGSVRKAIPNADHAQALSALLAYIDVKITAVGHRVVHGATLFTEPVILSDIIIRELTTLSSLAPLHNPIALAVIAAARVALHVPHVACFDTAFHANQPELAARFAVPDILETQGLRRYGFHGLSYAGLVTQIDPLPKRLLACHLGNGASLCAIVDGVGVATTMGYSPLDGLTMGTRSGTIDPSAVLELARRVGIDAAEAVLLRDSGLKGLSGISSDMRALEDSDTQAADFAIAHFEYWVTRHAGSMIAAMGGIDGIAFTGGIGENAAGLRLRICASLAWTGLRVNAETTRQFATQDSSVSAYVIPAREEAMIAQSTATLLAL